jgi:hypothetical protein
MRVLEMADVEMRVATADNRRIATVRGMVVANAKERF